tara:strand:- start:360 stop:596 length:237 start_codon:yes stop_codon:yes gene_type:complete
MYYVFFNNEKPSELWDDNMLGDESFGKFYIGNGFVALNNIINNEPELLGNIKIKDEQNKSYTITEFLDRIHKLKIVLD